MGNIQIADIIILFFICSFLGFSFEYIYFIFKIRIWDYSKVKFNIHGRTSPLHMVIFGSLGTLFYYFGLEKLINLIYDIPDYYKFAMIVILILVNILQIFMIRNQPVISFYVTTQKERESFKKK